MKKIKSLLMVLLVATVTFCLVGCGQPKVINGARHETYGLFNEAKYKDPNVQYEVCVGNVVWGILTFSSVIGPVYFFGFDLYNPVAAKTVETYANSNVSGATIVISAPQISVQTNPPVTVKTNK